MLHNTFKYIKYDGRYLLNIFLMFLTLIVLNNIVYINIYCNVLHASFTHFNEDVYFGFHACFVPLILFSPVMAQSSQNM